MARVRKTSSDSPRRAEVETTAQIPASLVVGSLDTAVTRPEVRDAERGARKARAVAEG